MWVCIPLSSISNPGSGLSEDPSFSLLVIRPILYLVNVSDLWNKLNIFWTSYESYCCRGLSLEGRRETIIWTYKEINTREATWLVFRRLHPPTLPFTDTEASHLTSLSPVISSLKWVWSYLLQGFLRRMKEGMLERQIAQTQTKYILDQYMLSTCARAYR